MAWLITIALNVTMGVAWHRFLAFFNIFFKRAPEKPAGSGLGALRPMMSNGKPLDFEEADPEKDQFGVAEVEQFTWKGLLDFSTCTECGRCQSQCPAWNTAKPLSPKKHNANLVIPTGAKRSGGTCSLRWALYDFLTSSIRTFYLIFSQLRTGRDGPVQCFRSIHSPPASF